MKILIAVVLAIVLVVGIVLGVVFLFGRSGGSPLVQDYSEPLNGTEFASIDIDMEQGNLTIDRLTGGEPLLVGGTLEYYENSGTPARTLTSIDGRTTLALSAGAGRQPVLRLPWEACIAENDWMLHLNPVVSYGLDVHTGGGDMMIDLTGIPATRLAAETGGGSLEVHLPEGAAGLNATIKTGAGDVAVEVGEGPTGHNTVSAESGAGTVKILVPAGIAVRVLVTRGVGNVVVDLKLLKIDDYTYQTAGYESARDQVEITIHSGAGDVEVSTQ